MADLSVRASGTGELTLYRGEPEQYTALISPEAVLALNDYLDARRRVGEKVDEGSPLFRNRWDYQKLEGEKTVTRSSVSPDVAKRLNVEGMKRTIDRVWIRSGLKTRHGRYVWKTCHDFRSSSRPSAGARGPKVSPTWGSRLRICLDSAI